VLIWWIDSFAHRNGWYRWHVAGNMTDVQYPDWNGNGRSFSWSVPNLQPSGGRFVFRLTPR